MPLPVEWSSTKSDPPSKQTLALREFWRPHPGFVCSTWVRIAWALPRASTMYPVNTPGPKRTHLGRRHKCSFIKLDHFVVESVLQIALNNLVEKRAAAGIAFLAEFEQVFQVDSPVRADTMER